MALAIAEAVSSMQRAHAPTNRGRKRRTVSQFRVGVVDPIIAARPAAADTYIRINNEVLRDRPAHMIAGIHLQFSRPLDRLGRL